MTQRDQRIADQSGVAIAEADAQWIVEARASVRRLDGEVLAAIDRRNYSAADRLDRQRTKLERGIASLLGLPRPKS